MIPQNEPIAENGNHSPCGGEGGSSLPMGEGGGRGRNWSGTTFGNGGMHSALIAVMKVMDVRLIYAFVSVFVVPVCLLLNTNGSRSVAYRFYRKRFGYGRLRAAWNTYVNHCIFGQVVVDRFAMYAGKKFEIEVDGYDKFLELASKPEGFIQMSAHIGNYEIAGYTLTADPKVFYALVFDGEKESVTKNRNKMFSSTNIRMISVKPDMSHLFEINGALQRGETVSLPADRFNGSPRYVEQVFLGAKARFPQGPLSVATMRELDVLAVNVMKESMKKYHVYVTPLKYDKTVSRKEQIDQLSKSYVSELERMVRKYPHQWYNFFEFWQESA